MIATWRYAWDDTIHLEVNGCMETTVSWQDMAEWYGPLYYLFMNKIMPLVWLTMPGHE